MQSRNIEAAKKTQLKVNKTELTILIIYEKKLFKTYMWVYHKANNRIASYSIVVLDIKMSKHDLG